MWKLTKGLVGFLILFSSGFSAQAADSDRVTFAGKQILLDIGFSSTGFGYDTYGRVLARYLGSHLPGNPTVVPENRPGAGSLSLANYIFSAAPKDGTEIALVGRGVAMDPLLEGKASKAVFDATKFNWLGSMNNEVAGFFITNKAPAKNLQDVLAGKEIRVGSTGAGGDLQIFSVVLNQTLHTKLRLIQGYPGMNEILLAMERGELDGVVGYSWGVARLGSADALKAGRLKLIMQLALKGEPDLKNAPLVTDLVTNPDDKEIVKLIFARQSMGRPIVAPPGLSPAVAATLRKAFADTMHDPAFLAECEKLNLEVNFVSGRDVQNIVDQIYALPTPIVERARAMAQVQQ